MCILVHFGQQEIALSVPVESYIVVHKEKHRTFHFSNNSVKNLSIFLIIRINIPEGICKHTDVTFPTSPKQCLYTTL